MSQAASWFSRIPPRWILAGAALLGVACLASAVAAVTRGPYLGVGLTPDPKGIAVISVTPDGPVHGRLAAGDVIVSLRSAYGAVVPALGSALMDDPDVYPTFTEYNRFLDHQGEVVASLRGDPVVFTLADGRGVAVRAAGKRPLQSVSAGFWLLCGMGVLVFMVGVGIWAFRRGQATTRLVALSSLGYLLASVTIAVYFVREWATEPHLFWWLNVLNHLGYMLYGYCALVLLWHYPRPLGRFPMAPAFLVGLVVIWLNEVFQLVELPLHAFFLQYFFPFAFGIWFAWRQWVRTRGRPDDRAALLWFMLSVLISIGVVILLYFLPPLFHAEPVIPFWVGHACIAGLFFGLVLGVLRYRLFDLERWWFAAWVWFFGGLLVVLVDFGLLLTTQIPPVGALSLSLLLVGWVYFPARQWLWLRFSSSPSGRPEGYLPLLLEAFFSASTSHELQAKWQEVLRRIFDPLDARTVDGSRAAAGLDRDGLVLVVPDIQGADRHVELSGRSRGNRLFTPGDVRLASFILALARKSAGLRAAQERGAGLERERIARDLHDDVAPHLLMLVHRANTAEGADGARTALQVLRESIYALNDPRARLAEEVVADWRAEVDERTRAAGVELMWTQPEDFGDLWLSSRERMNLGRVLREAVTNGLRHGAADSIAVEVRVDGRSLTFELTQAGQFEPPERWRAGNGVANMRTRVAELGGEIRWHVEEATASAPPRLVVTWSIPLQHARGALTSSD